MKALLVSTQNKIFNTNNVTGVNKIHPVLQKKLGKIMPHLFQISKISLNFKNQFKFQKLKKSNSHLHNTKNRKKKNDKTDFKSFRFINLTSFLLKRMTKLLNNS